MNDSRRAADIDIGNGRLLRSAEPIYDLFDVVDESRESPSMNAEFHDEMVQRISVIAEKIAREVIPEIAERVIREEIEKLKKEL